MKVFSSWSGGKESCLSCYLAMRQGHDVACLFTMFSTTGRHTRSHWLSRELVLAQSMALEIPLYHGRASWNTYENEFKRALAVLKGKGIRGGVFGDLYLDGHREWVENVCASGQITPILPLWGMEGRGLLDGFVKAGFEAVVIAVKDDCLGIEWLGRKIDLEFIDELGGKAVDICGEKGEYHSVAVDGPMFKKRIEITDTRIARRKGMSFLEIVGFDLGEKPNAA